MNTKKKHGIVTLRNLLQRSVAIVAAAFLAMAIFASVYILVSKAEREEAKHEETVHATLAELLKPAWTISDSMDIQRLLKLVTKKEVIYGLVTENGDLFLYDYANRPIFQQILDPILTSDCSQLVSRQILFEGSRWRVFCTELISSDIATATGLPSPKLISVKMLPRLSLSWFDFLKISLPLSLLLVVSVIYLRSVVANKILKPIEGLAKLVRARMHKKEELTAEMLPKLDQSPSEIEELRNSFNELISTVQQHYQERSKFDQSMAMNQIAEQVAHDIRSPLSSLQAAVEYLGHMRIDDAKGTDVLNLLDLSAKRLTSIANGLLKKYKGDMPQNIIFSLHKILDELVGEFKGQAKHEQITFTKKYHSQAIELYGEPEKLQRAFGNIIKNAMEAMRFSGCITLQTVLENEFAVISIKDTGPGMTEETLKKVLAGGYSEGKKEGHGIGVTVAREVAKLFHGTLWTDSELGKGTTFYIRLPLPSTMLMETADREAQTMKEFVLNVNENEPIVVIDDEPSMRAQWRLVLESHGKKAILCESYEDFKRQKISTKISKTAVVDYHFDNSELRGTDIVAKLKTSGFQNLYLCTAEYWKPSTQKWTSDLGVKLCPKPLPKISVCHSEPQARNPDGIGIASPPKADRNDKQGYTVLVIDDDEGIRLSWQLIQKKLGIALLHSFENWEALKSSNVDLQSLDIAFVDKNIEGSQFSGAAVIGHLKDAGVRKIVLASGENEETLRQDPAFKQADFIVSEKIPASFKTFFS